MFTLNSLYAKFPTPEVAPETVPLYGDEMPEPYRGLLVHTHHMTVTVEAFYGDAVDVEVLECHRDGRYYLRKILLRLQTSRQVVQFGLVEVDLDCLSPSVADEILSGRTPLGRVLIEHDVLRTIEPEGYFRTEWPQQWSQTTAKETYGRLGVIATDGRPAVLVAEILTPIVDVS